MLETPEIKQVPKTPKATWVHGNSDATLSSKSLEVTQATKTTAETLLDLKTYWSPELQATHVRRTKRKQKPKERKTSIKQRKTRKSAPKLIIIPKSDNQRPM